MTRDDDRHDLDQTLAATLADVDTGLGAGKGPATSGMPGQRYRLEGELGRGGMGEVLSARDEQIGRSVAIKRLRSAPTPETEARFLREARIQGRLEHPAIVPVHELGRDDRGQPYFAMKQLAGKTLAEVLDQPNVDRKFTRNQLLRALVDVCLAIQFAHEHGVVHRDLKPSNIMLGDYGEVYVLDWGVAHVIGELEGNRFADIDTLSEAGHTLAGQLLGTPGYMSPEQVNGGEVDSKTDVFALGCILFEVLVGKPLLPRGKAGLVAAIAGTVSVGTRRGDVEIAPEFEQLCSDATALEHGARIASPRVLADKIQAHLDGDRDLELRRRIAAESMTVAKEALARGDGIDDHRTALRAASRALALDPEAKEPPELVARLMLETPREVPVEVDAAVALVERTALQTTASQGNWAILVIFSFIPILYLGGIDELWFVFAIPAVGFFVWFGSWMQVHRGVTWGIKLSMIANMGMVAVFSRLITPFLVAPAMGMVVAGLFALHRASGRALFVGVGFATAILGPWFLELAGVLSPTMRTTSTELVLDLSGSHLRPEIMFPMLVVYVIATMAITIVMSRSLATVHHESQRRLELQAWRLRQLVR